MAKPPLRYWFLTPPTTFDTYRADMLDVMQVAKNIYAPLVSTYLDGKPQGMIADAWSVDVSGRVWSFRIRKDLRFDDGAPITVGAVLENFRRIFWLTREDDLALNALLPGIKKRKKPEDPLPGLRADGDKVVFEFDRRPGNLFELIEQPVYAIANPKCFDAEGLWKDPFCSGASGEYRVESVTPESVTLRSRGVYPSVPGAPERVEIRALSASDNIVETIIHGHGDVALTPRFGLSGDTLAEIVRQGLRLLEAPATEMYFLQLNARRPPFRSKELRQSVRDVFLDALSKDSLYARTNTVDASFIPRGGIGYRSFPLAKAPHPLAAPDRAPVEVLLIPIARYPYPRDREIQTALENSLIHALKAHGLVPKVTHYQDRSPAIQRLRAGDFDAIIRYTGLLIDDPYADLRMMFMSQIGALIPDPSGTVPELIKIAERSDNPAERRRCVERINETVHDEASIITFTHSGLAFLSRPAADLSKVNLFSDPVEFRAISWNP